MNTFHEHIALMAQQAQKTGLDSSFLTSSSSFPCFLLSLPGRCVVRKWSDRNICDTYIELKKMDLYMVIMGNPLKPPGWSVWMMTGGTLSWLWKTPHLDEHLSWTSSFDGPTGPKDRPYFVFFDLLLFLLSMLSSFPTRSLCLSQLKWPQHMWYIYIDIDIYKYNLKEWIYTWLTWEIP